MNIYQKEQVLTLRENGETYAKIAEHLGLSVNTVKSFCRRKIGIKLKTINDMSEIIVNSDVCPQCGKQIIMVSKRKSKKFCSDECRVLWWNTHPENVNQKALYPFKCAKCGKDFTAYGNAKRRYCSHSCYCDDRFKRSVVDEKSAHKGVQKTPCKDTVRDGGSMNEEDFEREAQYECRMAVARVMLRKGIITEEEYRQIDTIFLEKFRPLLGSLRAEIPLKNSHL